MANLIIKPQYQSQFDRWLGTMSPQIKSLFKKWPIGTEVFMDSGSGSPAKSPEGPYWVIGGNTDGDILLTSDPHNQTADIAVCADYLSSGQVHRVN